MFHSLGVLWADFVPLWIVFLFQWVQSVHIAFLQMPKASGLEACFGAHDIWL